MSIQRCYKELDTNTDRPPVVNILKKPLFFVSVGWVKYAIVVVNLKLIKATLIIKKISLAAYSYS